MKQVIHDFRSGAVELIDVARPRPGHGMVLVANEFSVISSGTERMLVSFGSASLLGKAWREPERLRDVVDKLATDGLWSTLDAVRSKLGQPIPLGYSSAGVVVEVGDGVESLSVGDRVVSTAPHAELATVAASHVAAIPDGVASENAAYTIIASVGYQALRTAKVPVGGVVAVIGLGLIGELTMRLARALGCSAFGFDPAAADQEDRSSDPAIFAARIAELTGSEGVDAVIVTADVGGRGRGPAPIEIAQGVARRGGSIVLIGAGDPTLDRRAFYERELTFRVSRSYGDAQNFGKVLELMASGGFDVANLAPQTYALREAERAYEELRSGLSGPFRFEYSARTEGEDVVEHETDSAAPGRVVCGVIGAGNFGSRVLMPYLGSAGAQIRTVVSQGGLTAALAAEHHDAQYSATSAERIFDDPDIAAVFVATRHDSHVEHFLAAVEAGKHVWVEKPLALTLRDLDRVERAWSARGRDTIAMVGFNRRFAPTIIDLKRRISNLPKSFVYTVNAGTLDPNHWLLDPNVGGGRLIGEGVHFVDLVRFLAGNAIESLAVERMSAQSAVFTLRFADGSVGSVQYLSDGAPTLAKERLEVFDHGRVFRIENFRRVKSWGARRRMRDILPQRQDKGHLAAIEAFLDAVAAGGPPPVPFEESLEVHRALLRALEAL